MSASPGFLVMGLLVIVGCRSTGPQPGTTRSDGGVPLFENLGSHSRVVKTSDPLAQRYFDQGLTFAYAFNHDEAIRSFGEAARLDPDFAMAWWGVALCHGPHINNPMMTDERSRAAWQALKKTLLLQEHAAPADRALILALSKRYAHPIPEDRKPLDQAYAEAMREVRRAYPEDSDIGTLFAEAMMDLRPWDLWTSDGQPQPGTEEIISVLDDVLAKTPRHPGANHLYIHVIEASPHPEKAIPAADRLRNLVPAAGHLVHMPSHIDVLTGRWALASEQNERAIKADRKYQALSPRQGFYRVYMSHNQHMLCFAAMMEGRSSVALRTAREMVAAIPGDYAREQPGMVDPYMMIVQDVMMRFGQWDEILKEPKPPSYLPITNASWHFARGIAYAAKGQIEEADAERAAFDEAVSKVPKDAMMAINPAHHVLSIARHVLNGEIAFRRGQTDEAVNELTAAIKLEDELRYMEPPEWIRPVRHTLGAVLLNAGRVEEAEKIYREDLANWPENGWSLYGLAQCLKKKGTTDEANDYEKRFRKAWARSDMKIHASCLCVPGRR